MTQLELPGLGGAPRESRIELADGALLLPGFALALARQSLCDVRNVVAVSPFRRLSTPGGRRMSVGMSCCGRLGWHSDAQGYRYTPIDPYTGDHWPAMPNSLRELATRSAAMCGYAGFLPDSCLVNRYCPGSRLTLHQDKNEGDFEQPIVSVSLGLPATFLFGGLQRGAKVTRVRLEHGDVVVWGGPARLAFHGIAAVADGEHPSTGRCRINLTFRRAA